MRLWRQWWQSLRTALVAPPPIPDALWNDVVGRYPFLAGLGEGELRALRRLSGEFLTRKEFTGAQGLQVSDAMALAIAAQACLPVLHLGLSWYADFRGIVVHPGAMLARREVQDEIGLVHRYTEELSGEAMDGGPVTLSWADADAPSSEKGYCVVIHEFVHKLDMRDGAADGSPPLRSRALQRRWTEVMQAAYDDFLEDLARAERFGGPTPWLDPYAATAPAEFFAVSAEAYFVNRERFGQEHPTLMALFDEFFRPPGASGELSA
jgi:Mlc titration factor MtfA (ptsG expression regulator)